MNTFAHFWPDGKIPAEYEEKRAHLESVISNLDEQTLKDLVPEGLVLGKTYQRCPKCKAGIDLLEGRNHIVCNFCSESLCFVCGQKALDRSGHWDRGGNCPRYNALNAENAMYDDPQGHNVGPRCGAQTSPSGRGPGT